MPWKTGFPECGICGDFGINRLRLRHQLRASQQAQLFICYYHRNVPANHKTSRQNKQTTVGRATPPVLPCVRFWSDERSMTKIKSSALMLSCTLLLASCLLLAQGPKPGEYPPGVKPSPMMSFFVTSEPIADGGNLG